MTHRHWAKVDANTVRQLGVGEAVVISRGRAARMLVIPAPRANNGLHASCRPGTCTRTARPFADSTGCHLAVDRVADGSTAARSWSRGSAPTATAPAPDRLMQVVAAAGITWECVRTWTGGRELERRLKRQGGLSRHCPTCRATGHYHR